MREAMRELRAQKEEAVTEWLRGRRSRSLSRWTDKDALRHVRTATERALVQDEWRDVIAAVREASRDPYGTPWVVQALAAEIGGQRREREHMEQKLRERAEGYRLGT